MLLRAGHFEASEDSRGLFSRQLASAIKDDRAAMISIVFDMIQIELRLWRVPVDKMLPDPVLLNRRACDQKHASRSATD